jgi:RNA recognition motif-containing protein
MSISLEFGKIRDVKIPFDKASGKNKKICILQFMNEDSARKAVLKVDKMVVDDKKLAVRLAEKKSVD